MCMSHVHVHVTCTCACACQHYMYCHTAAPYASLSTLHAPRTHRNPRTAPVHSYALRLSALAISSSYKLQLYAPAAEWHGTLTAVVTQRGGGGRYLSFNVWSLYKALSVPHVQPVRDGAHPHPSPI